MRSYDVVIVGAGPSGIATAVTLQKAGFRGQTLLVEKGRRLNRRVCPVDRGGACHGCGGTCNVLSGFGGGIHYGDAVKLSQLPSGRRLRQVLGPEVETHFGKAIELVEDTLQEPITFTFPPLTPPGAIPEGFNFKAYPVGSLPAASARRLLERLHAHLSVAPNLELREGVAVVDLQPRTLGGYDVTLEVARGETEMVVAEQVVVSIGRAGLLWWREMLRRLGLAFELPQPSVGLRFEMNQRLLVDAGMVHPDYKVTQFQADKKFKSFCYCAGTGGGRLKCTDYGPFALLDGHVQDADDVALTSRSPANFALLYQLPPVADGGDPFPFVMDNYVAPYRALRPARPGKPIAQRYADFRDRRAGPATWHELVSYLDHEPCIRDLQPARVDTLFGPAEQAAFCSAFETFMRVVLSHTSGEDPGSIDKALVVALELEGLWDTVHADVNMESSQPGLFVTGDALGVAQGILQAMTTGVAAGQCIADRYGANARGQSSRDRLVYDRYWTEGQHLEPSDTFRTLVRGVTSEAESVPPLILDLGCGIGRHTLHALQHGVEVVAIDYSSRAIARLKELIADQATPATVIEGDVRDWIELPVTRKADGIVCFDVIHHFGDTRSAVIDVLAAMRAHLRPGGYMLVTLLADIDYGQGGAPAGRLLLGLEDAARLLDTEAFADAQALTAKQTVVRFDRTVNLDSASGTLVQTHYQATRILRLYRMPL